MSTNDKQTDALRTLRYLRASPLMANHHAGLDAAIAALTQPAQPAEGGEAWAKTASELNRFAHTGKWPEDSTDPPASQEQAAPAWSDAVCDAGFQAMEARGFRVGASDIGKDDMKAMFLAMAEAAKASQEQAQQPSGGEVKAAPVESYPAQDQAFYAFWYSHMKGDLMQPPLADISHSTARYIWDSALATPKPEPMTDEQIANVVLQTVYAGDDSTPHRNAWAREIGIPFARAIEAHHGITKGSESAACSVCEGKGHVYRDGRCVGFCRCPAGRNALALNIPPAPITKGEA